jgi:hypothetical protein
VQVDDTGARHQGHNGFCTHIGNELFAYFESTDSKSRQNFLEVLRGAYTDYTDSGNSVRPCSRDYADSARSWSGLGIAPGA